MSHPPGRPAKPNVQRAAPLPSATYNIGQALGGSAPLAQLAQRVRDSQARLAVVAPMLAPPLLAHVRSGPLDDEAWTLLAANPAVAAKLRQMLPLLTQALADSGWPTRAIRVKILALPAT